MPCLILLHNLCSYYLFWPTIVARKRTGRIPTDKLCYLSPIRKVNSKEISNILVKLVFFKLEIDPVQVSPVHPSACFRLDYSILYSTLCDRLGDERTTLLLYMLLHQHQQFRNYVYTHADIQRMVSSHKSS